MGLQGVFDFCLDEPARPKRPERLFFALIPDLKTSLHINRVADGFVEENALKGSRIRADRLHVSLHHIGDFKRLKSSVVYAAKLAGDAVPARSFDITFRSIETFESGRVDGRRPLVLLGEGETLTQFHEDLGVALRKNGLQAADDFKPHMTLLYGATRVPSQPIDPICFPVKAFALIHSERGLTRYHILQHWVLSP